MVTGNAEVLIVDDEPHLCDALHRILKREGYCVRTCLLYTSPSPRD